MLINKVSDMANVYFTIGPKTEDLAGKYLIEIKSDPKKAGIRLQAFLNAETLKDWFDKDLQDLTIRQFISTLMSTKQPGMPADLNGWTPIEIAILSHVAVHCLNVDAFNNGAKSEQAEWKNFSPVQHEHIIFVNGSALTFGTAQVDSANLLVEGQLNSDVIFHYFEEQLMPVLLAINKAAAEQNENIVLNIPYLCCQLDSDLLEEQFRREFPKALIKIVETYAQSLTHIHTVNYDSSKVTGSHNQNLDLDIAAGGNRNIHFQMRPFQTEKRGSLEFPAGLTEDQIMQQHLVVAKLVASSPLSWPGSAIWVNNDRTDESSTFTSVNALTKLLEAGTLVITKPNSEVKIKYNPTSGCEQFYRQENGRDIFFSHKEMVDVLGLKFVAHSYHIQTIDYKENAAFQKEQPQSANTPQGFWSRSKPDVADDGDAPKVLPKSTG